MDEAIRDENTSPSNRLGGTGSAAVFTNFIMSIILIGVVVLRSNPHDTPSFGGQQNYEYRNWKGIDTLGLLLFTIQLLQAALAFAITVAM